MVEASSKAQVFDHPQNKMSRQVLNPLTMTILLSDVCFTVPTRVGDGVYAFLTGRGPAACIPREYEVFARRALSKALM
jgi:hypothetical protein